MAQNTEDEIGKITEIKIYGVEVKPSVPSGSVVGRTGMKSNVVVFKIGNRLQLFDLVPMKPGLPGWALDQLEERLGITEAKAAEKEKTKKASQETARQV